MTNYEYLLRKMSKNKSMVAGLMSASCSHCPYKMTTQCMSRANKDKSCYTLILEWLNKECEDNGYDE